MIKAEVVAAMALSFFPFLVNSYFHKCINYVNLKYLLI